MYNTAVKQADGEYVLLLDPGLGALSTGWLEALLQHAQRAEVGAVGGKLVSEEGNTLQAGLVLNLEEREDLPHLFYQPYNREHRGFRMYIDLVRNCSAVAGACMMFRKESFEAVGGFDAEHLEGVFGDVDLCLRLRERGYLIVYTPYAEFVQHSLESTAGLKPEQAGYVRERWAGVLKNDPYYNPNLHWRASSIGSMLDLAGLGDRPTALTKSGRMTQR
jgi:GT2 family glycosyltransferase